MNFRKLKEGFQTSVMSESSQSSRFQADAREVNDSLYELYKPDGDPSMQILFFHGLPFGQWSDAHISTWISGDGSCIWPQVWLPEEFPAAHILLVSYNEGLKEGSAKTLDMHNICENLTSDLTQANIGQTANCPLVLVGHSFGGLVIKDLCVEAHRSLLSRAAKAKVQKFLDNVRGIFFYGTPHHGSPHIERAATVMNRSLFEYFQVLSAKAARLNDDFNRLHNNYDYQWQIGGLGEQLAVTTGIFKGIVVVPESSAREGDFNLDHTADHFSVCRPEKKTSRRFNALTRLLGNICDDLKRQVPTTTSTGIHPEAQSIHQIAAEGNVRSLRGFLRVNPHIMIDLPNTRGQTAMHVAASCGNLGLANYLCQKGAEVNADDNDGRTPLHCASIQLHEPLVRFLLSKGADKSAKDDEGKTALDYAKDDLVISWMLRFGHSLEDTNPEKNDTALIYAAWAGNAEAVGYLLEQGADVEARNKFQYTALMDACRHGRIEVVKLLLKHGADKEARVGNEGWTPLLLGVTYGQIEVVKLMIAAGGNMEARSEHTGHTSLCEALWKRHWEIARLLLNSGADIYARDWSGYTPLNHAAMAGSVDDAKLILDKGADIDAKNKDDWTSLTEAACSGGVEMIQLLLDHGANIDAQSRQFDGKDEAGFTPLMYAADRGHLAACKYLLSRGANVDAKSNIYEYTPLFLAVSQQHEEVVAQLLAAGANPSPQNIHGWTPLEKAAWHGFDKVASLLLSAGADPDIPDENGYTPLCKAAWAQKVNVARILLEKGADIDAKNKDDWTSLTEAAFYGGVEMIQLLLDHGANIEAKSRQFHGTKDEVGLTPLMYAADRGHLAACKYLLSRGANVEAKTNINGWTPLFLAVSKKHEEIVRRLIQGGADILAANETGQTPLMEAARVRRFGMVKMMEEEFEKAKVSNYG